MVEIGNHPRPAVYDSVNFYDPNQVITPMANNPDYVRYKVGKQYFVYDVRRSTPALISIHALVSRFERFLRGHG